MRKKISDVTIAGFGAECDLASVADVDDWFSQQVWYSLEFISEEKRESLIRHSYARWIRLRQALATCQKVN